MPEENAEEVRAQIEKRWRCLKRERKERAEWMNRGEGRSHPRDYWKRENRPSPPEKVESLVDTLDAVL